MKDRADGHDAYVDDLIRTCRSYRRFKQEREVDSSLLERLIELAGLAASAANRQLIRYLPICDAVNCSKLFDHLSWAGYLPDWNGPAPRERPPAYIVVLIPKESSWSVYVDAGLASQNILLGAVARGLGGCILGAFDRNDLAKDLSLEQLYEPLLVIAIGEPAEEVVLESVDEEHDIRYWRDKAGRHHVPKRSVAELIVRTQPTEKER
jgi:nitroreductase